MKVLKRIWRALTDRLSGPRELRGMPRDMTAYEQKIWILQNMGAAR